MLPVPNTNTPQPTFLTVTTAMSCSCLIAGIALTAFSDHSCDTKTASISCTEKGVTIGLIIAGTLCAIPVAMRITSAALSSIWNACHEKKEEERELLFIQNL